MSRTIMEIVISTVLLAISGLLIPWLKAKTSAVQQEVLSQIADILVRAAEQIYGAELGKEKFDAVREWLIERGYSSETETAIETAIEAAVYRLKSE